MPNGQYDDPPPSTPQWLMGLHESVTPTPEVDPLTGPDPTSTELENLGGRGRPTDISQPVRGPRRPGTESGENYGASTAAASGGAEPNSAIEALYRGQYSHAPSRDIEQFGYDYFESRMPDVPEEVELVEGEEPVLGDTLPDAIKPGRTGTRPVSNRHVIGAGDEIVVSVTGTWELFQAVEVSRDGTILLPEFAPINVAGRTLGELPEVIKAAIETRRVGVEVTVGMGRTRAVQVNVVGEVNSPGMFTVDAPADVLDALLVAGGPKRSGTLRRIRLNRANGEVELVDLYDLLLSGQRPRMAPLQDGDMLYVPTIGPTVAVAGYVQNPAIFEVTPPRDVADLIQLAGGLLPNSYQQMLQIERTRNGRRETLDIPFDDRGMATLVENGDMLLIGAVEGTMRSIVRIEGEVGRPGEHEYREGMRFSDLVELADGLRIDASRDAAIINRQVGPLSEIQLLPGRRAQATSRQVIVVRDLRAALAGDEDHDHLLQPLDLVVIQPRSAAQVKPTVDIIGAVQRPGTYELTSGLRVSDLVALSGNLLPNAYADEAEIVRNIFDADAVEMSVRRMRINLKDAFELGGDSDPRLAHGDRVVVRQLNQTSVTVRISGLVKFPGTYVFPAHARITDLIAAAGGVLPNADIRASKFQRKSVVRTQSQRFKQFAEILREYAESDYTRLLQIASPQEALAGKQNLDHTRELIQRMARHQPDGRIVLDWTADSFPESYHNLTLEDGDALMVARRQETVSVVGHVFNSNAFIAEKDLNVQTLVEKCGGVTENGDEGRLYVIRADGTVRLVETASRRARRKFPIYPGDVVMVPRRRIERTMMAQIQDVIRLMKSGAETGLLLNNLEQTNLGISWVSGSADAYDSGIVNELID